MILRFVDQTKLPATVATREKNTRTCVRVCVCVYTRVASMLRTHEIAFGGSAATMAREFFVEGSNKGRVYKRSAAGAFSWSRALRKW